MAFEYQGFATLGVNLNRQKYGPLDISNVFTSEADLKYYLSKGTYTEGVSEYWTKVVPYPYEGQVLATAIDGDVKVYVLRLDTSGAFEAKAIEPDVDNKTIKLTNGKLELVGLPTTNTAGKTYVPSYKDGVLTWAEPDNSIVSGQGQEINLLKGRVDTVEETLYGIPAVEGTDGEEGTEAVPGLVDVVATNKVEAENAVKVEKQEREKADQDLTDAIAVALEAAKKYADEHDADTIYDDSALDQRVTVIENTYVKQSEKYDDTALASRVTTAESKITALETAVGDEATGLVKAVADNTENISKLDTAYKAADTQLLASAQGYTDTQISGLTISIEQKDSVDYIVVKNNAGVEVASVNASKFVQDSFLNDVDYNVSTGKVTFTWAMGDGSTKTDEIDIKHLVDTYTNGFGLTLDENNQFAVNTSVIATAEALAGVSATANAAQTAEQVSSAITKAFTDANLSQYAVKAAVEADLAKKVAITDYNTDKATFALKADSYTAAQIDAKGYAVAADVANVYATIATVNGVSQAVEGLSSTVALKADVEAELAKKLETSDLTTALSDYYTKSEVYNKSEFADLLAELNETSAQTISAKLKEHVDEASELFAVVNEKDAAQDALIEANTNAITAAATKTEQDIATALETAATTAAQKVEALKLGEVTTNANNIAALLNTTSSHTNSISNLQSDLSGLTTTVNKQTADIAAEAAARLAVESTVNGHTGRLTTLESDNNANKQAIEQHAAKFNDYATTTALNTAIANIDYSEFRTGIQTNKGNLEKEVQRATGREAELGNLITENATNLTNTAKDIRNEIKALDTVIKGVIENNDAEALNSIKELAAWINNHSNGADGVLTQITNNTNAISTLNGEGDGSVKKAIKDAIAAIPATPIASTDTAGIVKASDEVAVDETGKMSVSKVSTDVLVQGELTLVLYGGTAVASTSETEPETEE